MSSLMGPQDINEETQQSVDDSIMGNAAYIQHLTKSSGVMYNPADEISAVFVSTESTFTTVSTSHADEQGCHQLEIPNADNTAFLQRAHVSFRKLKTLICGKRS